MAWIFDFSSKLSFYKLPGRRRKGSLLAGATLKVPRLSHLSAVPLDWDLTFWNNYRLPCRLSVTPDFSADEAPDAHPDALGELCVPRPSQGPVRHLKESREHNCEGPSPFWSSLEIEVPFSQSVTLGVEGASGIQGFSEPSALGGRHHVHVCSLIVSFSLQSFWLGLRRGHGLQGQLGCYILDTPPPPQVISHKASCQPAVRLAD